MQKFSLFLIKYKFSLGFIALALLFPMVILPVFTSGIQIPSDIAIILLFNLILILVLGRKIELKEVSKFILIVLTTGLSTLSPLILMALLVLSPVQQGHDKVMYEVCLPELRKYYKISEQESFPYDIVDKDGNAKWWFQHLECEDNVAEGKGPIFSDDPVDFKPSD